MSVEGGGCGQCGRHVTDNQVESRPSRRSGRRSKEGDTFSRVCFWRLGAHQHMISTSTSRLSRTRRSDSKMRVRRCRSVKETSCMTDNEERSQLSHLYWPITCHLTFILTDHLPSHIYIYQSHAISHLYSPITCHLTFISTNHLPSHIYIDQSPAISHLYSPITCHLTFILTNHMPFHIYICQSLAISHLFWPITCHLTFMTTKDLPSHIYIDRSPVISHLY